MRYIDIDNLDNDPAWIVRQRQQYILHNQIMIYVLQACSELGQECLEVYASAMKCVYRFPGESEDDAHWFFFSHNAGYESVRNAVHDALLEKNPHYDAMLWAGDD